MITLIEARNFRCLRYIRQPLGPLHVLVGPNASGKTTFLDSVAFLGRLVSDGLEAAASERSQDFRDLVWRRTEGNFELAVEAGIPAERRRLLADREFETVRYEVSVGPDPDTKETSILGEKVLLRKQQPPASSDGQRTLFPAPPEPPATILMPKMTKGAKTVVNKVRDGNDNFYDETGKGWDHAFKLGPRKSALANLPEDESKFPVSTWLKALLIDGVQQIVLNSLLIRLASPPGQVRSFKPDGSNLPWVIDNLQRKSPDRFQQWIAHVQTALPDVEGIRTVERPEDRHRYLVLRYRGGLEVPSWVASDGTLRLLALTLLAYLPEFYGVYLIEEPENGIHPLAVESVFQSLSSAYDAQILVATHSPVMLSLAEADKILCFAKTPEGATDIVVGSDHPALRDWRGETNLADLFAAGVLGQ
jgi:predicted ATPase